MSRGIMDGINKVKAAQARMASGMKGYGDESIDTDISPEEEDEVVRDFEDGDLGYEKEHKSSVVIPRKVKQRKMAIKEQPIKYSIETPSELMATPSETPIKKRKVLVPLKHVKAVETIEAPSLPTALRPKEEKKSVRFSTHVDSEVLENIQYLKANGKIKSISSLVTIALMEFIEKYQLME